MGSLRDAALSLQPQQGVSLRDMALANATQQPALAESASLSGPFEAGIKSAVRSSIGGMKGLAAGVVDAYGGNPNDLYAAAAQDAAMAEQIGPKVRTLRDIGGAEDAAAYALGHMGSTVPFVAMGGAGGWAGRGLNRAAGLGMTPGAAAHAGAVGAFVPTMAGEQIHQMHQLAPDMPAGERLARGLGVGTAQAVAGAVPGSLLARAPGAQPFWKGLGTQLAAGGAGMAGMDVIGQVHRMDYQPGYQFDPEQTLEATAAGAVGMLPMALPHAAAGQMGHSGVEVGRFAKDNAAAGLDTSMKQLKDGAKWVGEHAYAAMPDPLKKVVDYAAKGGELTKEMADALKPYAKVIGGEAKDILSDYWGGLKETGADIKQGFDMKTPMTPEEIATDVYANTVKATGAATEASRQIIESIKQDANIPEPVRTLANKVMDKVKGEDVDALAEALSDKRKWLNEEGILNADSLGAMEKLQANSRLVNAWAEKVKPLVEQADARGEGPAAQELRALLQKHEQAAAEGKALTPQENERMFAAYQLSKQASGLESDLLNILKFDGDLKAGQDKAGTTLMGKDIQFSRAKQRAAEDQLGLTEKSKQGKEVSLKFREAVRWNIKKLFDNDAIGRELTSDPRMMERVSDAIVDFSSKLAKGEKGYDQAARRLLTYLRSKMNPKGENAGDLVGDMFIGIMDAADAQFGIDSKQAKNIMRYRDDSISMRDEALKVRALLKDRDAFASETRGDDRALYRRIEELLGDVDRLAEMETDRGKVERARDWYDEQALATTDKEKRFEYRKASIDLDNVLNGMGMNALKKIWVNERGIVDAKNFEGLYKTVLKYGKHEDRLTKPERRGADHEISANHTAEADLDAPSFNQGEATEGAAIKGREVKGLDGNERGELIEKRSDEKYGGNIREQQPPSYFGTNALRAGGHKADDIGAPVAGATRYRAIEESHAKYGHRVAKGKSVSVLEWAEDMARRDGKKSEYHFMTEAMDRLLAHDAERLKSGELDATSKKFIAARAEMAENLKAEWARKGRPELAGGHFFADKMNKSYRYYKMEQHDGSTLSHTAEQLRAFHGVREEENRAAFIERIAKKEGGIERDGKFTFGKFPKQVYENSMLPVRIGKEMVDIDIAGLTASNMRMHQPADVSGVSPKNNAEAVLNAFYESVAAVMTAEGVAANDPLGVRDFSGRVLMSKDAAGGGKNKEIAKHMYFPADMVVMRDVGETHLRGENDMSGRGVEAATPREAKNTGDARVWTFGQLTGMLGMNKSRIVRDGVSYIAMPDGKVKRIEGSPGRLSEVDLGEIFPPLKDKAKLGAAIAQRNAQANPAEVSRAVGKRTVSVDSMRQDAMKEGVAHAGARDTSGVEQHVNLRRGLVRMLERNGIDATEALREGKLPKETAAMLMRELFQELQAGVMAGNKRHQFAGELFDKPETFKELVLYHERPDSDSPIPVTLGKLLDAGMLKGVKTERDLGDARLQVAVRDAAKAYSEERAAADRAARGVVSIEDKVTAEGRAAETDRAERSVDSEAGQWYRELSETEKQFNEIDEILKAVKQFEGVQHDLSEAMRRQEPTKYRKAYGESEGGEHVVAGEAPKKVGELPEPVEGHGRAELLKSVGDIVASHEAFYNRLKNHPDPEVQRYAENWAPGFNEAGDMTPAFKKFLEKKSEETMAAAWEQEKATYGQSLTQEGVAGKSVEGLPLDAQKANARIQSTEVRTNQAELETAAFRRENRNILAEARARRESEKEARAADMQARWQSKNDKANRAAETAVATEKATLVEAEQQGFDAKSIVRDLVGTKFEDGDSMQIVDLMDGISSAELREIARGLPKTNEMRGTMGEVLANALKNRYATEAEAAGVRFDPTTGKFEVSDVQYSHSKPKQEQYTSLVHDEAWVKGEVSRLLKDAFGLKLENGMKDKDGNPVAGAFDGKTIFVNMAEGFARGEATHHEVWHGVEKLLGGMGEHGKAVLGSIHKHVDTPFMKRWLAERTKGEVDEVHLDTPGERAAYVFQKVMAGEKMPLAAETRTRFEKIVDWVRKVAEKLGFGTTTAGDRTANFFEYVKSGNFARDMENAPSVRKGLGEKLGDNAIQNTAKALKPLAEGFEKVFSHTSTRINKLGIKEYDDILKTFSGEGGKSGFVQEQNRQRVKLSNEIGPKLAAMSEEQARAFALKKGGEYDAFIKKTTQLMRNAGVPEKQAIELAKRVDSFNLDKVNGDIEAFIVDLINHGGFKGRAGEARTIANEIANKGYYYSPEVKLFEKAPEVAEKWMEKSVMEKTMRYVDIATRLAARTEALGVKQKYKAEDGREYWMEEKLHDMLEAGDKLADADGRKLIRDYISAVDGKLGDLSPGLRKVQGGLMFAQNVHALPLMVFSQMLEPLQIAMRSNKLKGSLDSMFRGIRDLPRTFEAVDKSVTPDQWEKLSYQIGTAPHRIIANVMTDLYNGMHTSGPINKWNEAFFRYNLSEQWNRSMHIEATKQGVEFLRDHSQGISKNSPRFLKELGLTKEDIKFNGDGELVLNDKVEKALVQFVEESMAHPDAGSNPMWMNDTRFALLAQMKRFTFAHTKYILDRGINEYKLGNAFPIAPAIIAMPWMLAADGLRDTLTLKDNAHRASWGLLDYAQHAYERAGLTGRAQFGLDVGHAVGRGGSPVEALGGPSLEMFGNIARGAHNGHLLDATLDYVPGGALVK